MAFSAKDIKKAQRIANDIVRKNETKRDAKQKIENEQKHYEYLCDLMGKGILSFPFDEAPPMDPVKITPARTPRDILSSNATLMCVVEQCAEDGDEYSKQILDVTGMMADDMMDNIQRAAGADVPVRERSDADKFRVLMFKIRMQPTRHYLEQAMLHNMSDRNIMTFMTLLRTGRLPSEDLVQYIQNKIQELIRKDQSDFKDLHTKYGTTEWSIYK
jgi:hypothetical protein